MQYNSCAILLCIRTCFLHKVSDALSDFWRPLMRRYNVLIWLFAWTSLPRSFEVVFDELFVFRRRLNFLFRRRDGRAGAEEQDKCPSSPDSARMLFLMLWRYSPKNWAFIWSGRSPFLCAVYRSHLEYFNEHTHPVYKPTVFFNRLIIEKVDDLFVPHQFEFWIKFVGSVPGGQASYHYV